MPRKKKSYIESAVNPEDVTIALSNAVAMVRNFLNQRIEEALVGRSGKQDTIKQNRFKVKSKRILREITQMYYSELIKYCEGDQPRLLPEELCLSFCVAALMTHGHIDKKALIVDEYM